MRRRRGYTIIELALALAVAMILAAFALSRVTAARYRMDGAARLVQNVLLGAQQQAVMRGVTVLVIGNATTAPHRLEVVEDTDGDGVAGGSEPRRHRALPSDVLFAAPPATIDGAAAAIATGAGVSVPASGLFQVSLLPGGGASGDAVFYLGTPAGRDDDRRAVQLAGSTAKTVFWRARGTTWRPDAVR